MHRPKTAMWQRSVAFTMASHLGVLGCIRISAAREIVPGDWKFWEEIIML